MFVLTCESVECYILYWLILFVCLAVTMLQHMQEHWIVKQGQFSYRSYAVIVLCIPRLIYRVSKITCALLVCQKQEHRPIQTCLNGRPVLPFSVWSKYKTCVLIPLSCSWTTNFEIVYTTTDFYLFLRSRNEVSIKYWFIPVFRYVI